MRIKRGGVDVFPDLTEPRIYTVMARSPYRNEINEREWEIKYTGPNPDEAKQTLWAFALADCSVRVSWRKGE